MNKIIKLRNILCVASLLVVASSCQKSFLDQEPSEYLAPEQLSLASVWNPDILLGQAAGATAISYAGQTATQSHTDFGQKSSDIQMDILSGDIEVERNHNNSFAQAAQLVAHQRSNISFSYVNWRVYYKIAFSANSLLDLVGTDELASLPADITAENKFYWGQSKVLRAYAYFYLANFYAGSYDVAQNEPAIPIYRSAKSNEAAPKSTLAEVYKQIITDLKEGREAIEASRVSRTAKSQINADVASSYLAYAYLQSGDYANAHTEAKRVIDGGNFRLLRPSELTTNGFNNVSNPEFIWAIEITKDNSNSLLTFWGHMDLFTYSYHSAGASIKRMNLDLQNSIPATDLRAGWFHTGAPAGRNGMPTGKFFSEENTAKAVGADRSWLSDIHHMRLADMYLVAMEAAARKGDATEAKRLLKELMAQRTDASNIATVNNEIDGLNDADLLERIRYNWRVEMWGEGRALMTMKRFKASVTRTSRSTNYPGQTFRYDDARFVYQIPQREVSNNPRF